MNHYFGIVQFIQTGLDSGRPLHLLVLIMLKPWNESLILAGSLRKQGGGDPEIRLYGESKSSCTFKGFSKKSVVCVNRLDPSTSADTISDFLQSNGIDVISCFLLNRDEQVQRNFTSARLCGPQPHLTGILDHNFWPFGVVVSQTAINYRSACHLQTCINGIVYFLYGYITCVIPKLSRI